MADHRHKRDTNARRTTPFRARATFIAGPLAMLATGSAVSLGVITADLGEPASSIVASPVLVSPALVSPTTSALEGQVSRRPSLSRGGARLTAKSVADKESRVEKLLEPAAKRAAIAKADTKRWTTTSLNLWTEPGTKARKTDELPAGTRVVLTGRSLYGREEIVWGTKQVRWVTQGYVADQKPFTLGGACTNGTSVPAGVSENIKKVHAAVCAEFPGITVYGTFRSDGEHAQGIAVDIMVSGAEGYAVADFVRKYYVELGVSYIIYSQRIWSVERGGEGWRGMASRGSTTADHYDHVHVTTY